MNNCIKCQATKQKKQENRKTIKQVYYATLILFRVFYGIFISCATAYGTMVLLTMTTHNPAQALTVGLFIGAVTMYWCAVMINEGAESAQNDINQ